MRAEQLRKGDPIVFTKTKCGPHPGPRAENIRPSSHGEYYSYLVKKFWTVLECRDDHLVAQTRRGKRHRVDLNDPALRTPSFWEQFLYRKRFPRIDETDSMAREATRETAREATREAAGEAISQN